jgi:hypothetical protein
MAGNSEVFSAITRLTGIIVGVFVGRKRAALSPNSFMQKTKKEEDNF